MTTHSQLNSVPIAMQNIHSKSLIPIKNNVLMDLKQNRYYIIPIHSENNQKAITRALIQIYQEQLNHQMDTIKQNTLISYYVLEITKQKQQLQINDDRCLKKSTQQKQTLMGYDSLQNLSQLIKINNSNNNQSNTLQHHLRCECKQNKIIGIKAQDYSFNNFMKHYYEMCLGSRKATNQKINRHLKYSENQRVTIIPQTYRAEDYEMLKKSGSFQYSKRSNKLESKSLKDKNILSARSDKELKNNKRKLLLKQSSSSESLKQLSRNSQKQEESNREGNRKQENQTRAHFMEKLKAENLNSENNVGNKKRKPRNQLSKQHSIPQFFRKKSGQLQSFKQVSNKIIQNSKNQNLRQRIVSNSGSNPHSKEPKKKGGRKNKKKQQQVCKNNFSLEKFNFLPRKR